MVPPQEATPPGPAPNPAIRRLNDTACRVSEVLAVAIVVVIFTVMLAQVFFRYVLNSSLLWSEELAVWCLAWVVFVGAVGLVRDWRHVHVPLVLLAMPISLRIPAIILSKLLSTVFLAILFYQGVEVFNSGVSRTSPVLGISSKWAKLAIPVGSALMLVLAVASMAEDVRAWRAKRSEHFAAYGRPDVI
jgi:TRAP-type C4-dicarboxylate transport system permease small subunit